jgi:hypothetical protein
MFFLEGIIVRDTARRNPSNYRASKKVWWLRYFCFDVHCRVVSYALTNSHVMYCTGQVESKEKKMIL